jgi:hypothetical protein
MQEFAGFPEALFVFHSTIPVYRNGRGESGPRRLQVCHFDRREAEWRNPLLQAPEPALRSYRGDKAMGKRMNLRYTQRVVQNTGRPTADRVSPASSSKTGTPNA